MKITVLTDSQIAEFKKKARALPEPKPPKPPKLKSKMVYTPEEANSLLSGLLTSCRVEVVHIEEAFSSGVYLWLDEEQEVKYVGRSNQGLQRALNVNSSHGQNKLFKTIETVLVLYCETDDQASLIERQLILAFQPEYNLKSK